MRSIWYIDLGANTLQLWQTYAKLSEDEHKCETWMRDAISSILWIFFSLLFLFFFCSFSAFFFWKILLYRVGLSFRCFESKLLLDGKIDFKWVEYWPNWYPPRIIISNSKVIDVINESNYVRSSRNSCIACSIQWKSYPKIFSLSLSILF